MGTDTERDKGGRFTSLFNKDKPADPSQPAASDVGSSPGGAAIAEARAEAKAGLEGRRGRGRPRKEPGVASMATPASPAPGSSGRIPPEVLAELERLYSPEIWEPMVELPGAAMQTLTGHDLWEITEKEKRVLSVSVSTAARYMGFTNPKWLAINLALINLMTVYAPRAIKEMAVRRLEQPKPKTPPAASTSETK